mmetsp:Transcript_12842/g.26669  ORF Transcript_12842/g.26669 Transcript_12842/m.26669 type:complete len:219 (+) Transcript_12842:999-1655(+)
MEHKLMGKLCRVDAKVAELQHAADAIRDTKGKVINKVRIFALCGAFFLQLVGARPEPQTPLTALGAYWWLLRDPVATKLQLQFPAQKALEHLVWQWVKIRNNSMQASVVLALAPSHRGEVVGDAVPPTQPASDVRQQRRVGGADRSLPGRVALQVLLKLQVVTENALAERAAEDGHVRRIKDCVLSRERSPPVRQEVEDVHARQEACLSKVQAPARRG